MIILGAGMAGCVAGILNPTATLLEGSSTPPDNHNAVLRFRTDNISKVTGVPFRKVTVRKAIWYLGSFHQPNPLLANLYSKKVSGRISPRSIWNVDPVERYIAPPDFHMQLLNMLVGRIRYGAAVKKIDGELIHLLDYAVERVGQPIISTVPMPVMIGLVDKGVSMVGFHHQSIFTERWRVEDCDVHQTIYFPDPGSPLYRATLTGGDLILEGVNSQHLLDLAAVAFGIDMRTLKYIKGSEQKYGKIAPVDDSMRKKIMFDLTNNLHIYSLGRFACWRNILLDDVYEDIFKIRRMLSQDAYDIRKEL